VRRVFTAFLSPFHEQIVDLKTSILNLLLSLFGFSENWPGLWVAIAVRSFEIRLKIFIALMNHADDIDKSRSFL
jgi:hypothetical protein